MHMKDPSGRGRPRGARGVRCAGVQYGGYGTMFGAEESSGGAFGVEKKINIF